MSIGERITELRKKNNITQVELAKMLDVSRQAVSKWENDTAAPDTIKLIRLADALDTDVEYLATGNHSKLKSDPKVVTVFKPVEVEKIVEKVIKEPVYIEKIVEVEKPIETVVENTRIKKVFRTKYVRNPIEFLIVGLVSFLAGALIGMLL